MISLMLLIVSTSTFAGGLLTNTNQHAAFLRMLSRGATTEIDGALSNPAGLAFLPTDGFHMSLSIQSAFQTRNIDASCEGLGLNKYYEGKASAPVIPSLFAAYKTGDWTLSGFFGITGGGGKASFDDGLPMFDAMVIGGLGAQKIPSNAYSLKSYMDGKQYIYSVQLGLTYKATDWLSVFAGGRMNYFTGGYQGALNASAATNLPLPTGGTITTGTELIGIDLDCSQTGWGFTPVIGLDAKLGKLNIGAKYEFMTNLNIENSTKENSLRMIGAAESELADYKHGVNTPNDIPSMLSVAVAYEFIPVLRASVEYHFFRVGHLPVVEDFLNWVGAFVDWSVRQWAHVFEFLIIGICVSIFYACATKKIWLMPVLALLTCMCISLCDQSVRIFIVGRHFDSFDLVLDALGYVSAIVVVSICRGIYRLVVNREK